MFTQTVCRAHRAAALSRLFAAHLVARLLLAAALAVLLVLSFPRAASSLCWLLWCLGLALVSLQLVVLVLGLGWLLAARSLRLGRLMSLYSGYLAKVDVARGRSVPSPVEAKPVQVLASLNPYTASPDLRLLLDLLAARRGSGLALRVLAQLEPDFAASWAPCGLQLEAGEGAVRVYWKDALVTHYLASTSSLQVHYGVEVEAGGGLATRVISHQEVRFMKQTWRATQPAAVQLGLGAAGPEFIYHETFPLCGGGEAAAEAAVVVRVWTVVNSQLVTCTQRRLATSRSAPGTPAQVTPSSSTPGTLAQVTTPSTPSPGSTLTRGHRRLSTGSQVEAREVEDRDQDDTQEGGDGGCLQTVYTPANTRQGRQKKSSKSSKSSSETNLHFNNNNDDETFSRKAKNRKSLPIGHVNLAFIREDDTKDPYLLI